MAEKISPDNSDANVSHNEKSVLQQDLAPQEEHSEAPHRRKSAALNIVQNPLKVSLPKSERFRILGPDQTVPHSWVWCTCGSI
jgi:hypothetical protein